MGPQRRRHGVAVVAAAALVVSAGVGLWAFDGAGGQSATTTTTSPPSPASAASVVDDAAFLADVSRVDPALATYEQRHGNVALRSLLTDGSAFCDFLARDGDIDDAMVSVAVAAQRVESQTDLPMSVTTFNTIEAVAVLRLCPSQESAIPTADRARIRALGATLGAG